MISDDEGQLHSDVHVFTDQKYTVLTLNIWTTLLLPYVPKTSKQQHALPVYVNTSVGWMANSVDLD